MKKILTFLLATFALVACQPTSPEPTAPTPENLIGRSVLTYSNTQYINSYEVTEYGADGVPVLAKTSVSFNMSVSPTGIYTSSIKLEYDSMLRLKKTIQTYNQLGYASCCPGSIAFDPDRQIINEYDYQGNTKNITHEVNYTLNAKKGERVVVSEYFRTFTDGGKLTQEKKGSRTLYEAVYDANDNVLSETMHPAYAGDRPAFTRRWEYIYDSNKNILSRKISDSDSFEANTYDSQGRLTRRVTNLFATSEYTPTTENRGKLIDYSFTKPEERRAMSFTYFNGQFFHDVLRVVTYAYTGEGTMITNTAYKLQKDIPQANQPGFDFTQIPTEMLLTVKQTKLQLNKQHKLVHEDFSHVYVSDKLRPEQLDATYASEYTYTYDELGNLTGSRGKTVSPIDKGTSYPTPTFEARYKSF